MFWSDVGNTSNQATIYRSKMDGTEITPIIRNLTMPASMYQFNVSYTGIYFFALFENFGAKGLRLY